MNHLRESIGTCKEWMKCPTEEEMYFRGMMRVLWYLRLLGITAYIETSSKHLPNWVKKKNNEKRWPSNSWLNLGTSPGETWKQKLLAVEVKPQLKGHPQAAGGADTWLWVRQQGLLLYFPSWEWFLQLMTRTDVRRGKQWSRQPALWVHRNLCWDRLEDACSWSTACKQKKGIKCSKGCSSKLFLPDLESLFDEIKMAFSALI